MVHLQHVTAMKDNERSSNLPQVTAIIQARMQSKRLPGKSMKSIGGKPIIAHVIERAQMMTGITRVVVATCEDNAPLIECAHAMGADAFVGSEHNVLERYTLAARQFGGDWIVRITGDNPFTDVEHGSSAILKALESKADLASVSGIPLGTGIEVIKREALERAFREGTTPYHFEHVTPYIKEHPELFTIRRFDVSIKNPFPHLRLTVDTEEDFQLATLVCDSLYKGSPFPVTDVIGFFTEHPDLVTINSSVEQRPMTHSETK
jgi:spore coat polysaccharide biosynthesis protein SpsF